MPTNFCPPSPAALAHAARLVLTLALSAALMSSQASAQSSAPGMPPGTAPALRAQVEIQPYLIGAWAGFQPRSITDLDILVLGEAGEADAGDLDVSQPLLTIAVSSSPSPAQGAREAFARRALEFVALASDIVVEHAETVRRGEVEWHETVGLGHSLSGREVIVFQSIRFGTPGAPYLRVVGLAPADLQDTVLPRFRQVARSIMPKGGNLGTGP